MPAGGGATEAPLQPNSGNEVFRSGAPQVVEICCGSARLCAAFRGIRTSAFQIDWSMNRHVQKSPWLSINVATQEGLAQVLEILSGWCKSRLVWFGVPCGTASRAREVVKGPNMPPQLGSAMHQKDELTEKDAKKVQASNRSIATLEDHRVVRGQGRQVVR